MVKLVSCVQLGIVYVGVGVAGGVYVASSLELSGSVGGVYVDDGLEYVYEGIERLGVVVEVAGTLGVDTVGDVASLELPPEEVVSGMVEEVC